MIIFLSACGEGTGSDEWERDDCSSCWVTEDIQGNEVLICSNITPLGTSCYGGLTY